MDLIALLPDFTDDEDDDDDDDTRKNKNSCCPRVKASTGNEKNDRPMPTFPDGRGTKLRRRGSIDVVSSREAHVSGVFSRCIPHRRGHWAGHIKVPISTTSSLAEDSDVDFFQKLKASKVERMRNLLERNGVSGTMVEHDDLHLSLSKYFSLQIAQIEPFVRRLEEILQQESCTNLLVETAGGLQEPNGGQWDVVGHDADETIVLLNEEKTRSFFCWTVRPTAILRRIVAHIDGVLKRYNQPVYYQPAHFHISFASFPGNVFGALNKEGDCSWSHDDEESQKHFQSLPSHGGDCSTVANSGNGECDESKGDDDDDGDCSSSSSSFVEESFVLPVQKLLCTIGTTKEFAISLRDSKKR